MNDDLPSDIIEILEYLAAMARGYDNHLKWNEVAKLKADLMNRRQYWRNVPVDAVNVQCTQLGMRAEDVQEICEYIQKAQAGRRLVPQRGYRDFHFRRSTDRPPLGPPNALEDPSGSSTTLRW